MGRTGRLLVIALTLAAPAAASAQAESRAAELQARRAERAAERRPGGSMIDPRISYAAPGGWPCPLIGLYGVQDDPCPGYPGQGYAGDDYRGAGHPGQGYPGQGYGPPGYIGRGSPIVAFGYPDPYRDWASIWGRGWLDATPVPPYHRFQYRFFPETLPDPTRQGYPGFAAGSPAIPLVPLPAAPALPARATRAACAVIRIERVDGETDGVTVALPLMGALTPDALESVIRDRLRRGGGVAVRGADGYVFRFPVPETIRDLSVGGC